MLAVITPTGARPDAFKLCQQWMTRQTYPGPIHWIIVDDGPVPLPTPIRMPKNWMMTIVRPKPLWEPGQNTQGRNLKAGLEEVERGWPVTIVEDDDYYAPGWLEWVVDMIPATELIGERDAIYYNVKFRRFSQLGNKRNASLRCTAMRDGAIEKFHRVLERPQTYYDLQLWKHHARKLTFPRLYTVGIKGMPGRGGIARGHDRPEGEFDPRLSKLRAVIGEDAAVYAPFYQGA